MRNKIKINGINIGEDYQPYIIAEMSANHNGDISKAFKIINAAKEAGADAVKLQTYTADTLTIKSDLPDFKINDGLWAGKNLYDLYQWANTPWEWHEDLFNHAHDKGITIFSSPFDRTAVDLLEELNAPAYKIASFEVIDLPLIKYVASKNKPMIISTGMANLNEIEEAIKTARENGCDQLAVLHCVSGYPAPSMEYNLKTIQDMKEKFGVVIGLSDHTLNNTTAITSVALGASIIEKHFTLDKKAGGPDDSFSLEPTELKDLCNSSKISWESLGNINYERKKSESSNLKFRRSIYFIKDMKKGDIITEDSIKIIRPGYGIAPKYFEELLGKKVHKDVCHGMSVSKDCLRS